MHTLHKNNPRNLTDAVRNFSLCQEFGEYLDLQHMLKLFILDDRTLYYRPMSLKYDKGKRFIEAFTDKALVPEDDMPAVIGRSVRNLLLSVLLDQGIDSVVLDQGYEIRKEYITALLSRHESLTA